MQRKYINVNGINYYLVGNAYMPTAPGLVPDRHTTAYGMVHLKYLQEAHPEDMAELQASGRVRQYLLRVDQIARLFIEDREKTAPVPELSDPAFEEKYIRHNSISHNARCKAENKYVYTGLHRDILAGIKEPDGESTEKVYKIVSQEDRPGFNCTYSQWLDEHPSKRYCVERAKSIRREYEIEKARRQKGKR